jgi:hypothetical protein
MKLWLRRFLYLAIVLLWLLVMSLPTFAFFLAMRGQLQLGSQDGRFVRVFLLQEPDAEGVGVERQRLLREPPGCRQTTVSYWMWVGEAENVSFCQCFDPVSNAPLPSEGLVCRE